MVSFRSFIGSQLPDFPSSGSFCEFLQAPLPSSTYSLLSGLWLDLHQLVRDHAGRTTEQPRVEESNKGLVALRRFKQLRERLHPVIDTSVDIDKLINTMNNDIF
jgi:hypothetical protein